MTGARSGQAVGCGHLFTENTVFARLHAAILEGKHASWRFHVLVLSVLGDVNLKVFCIQCISSLARELRV